MFFNKSNFVQQITYLILLNSAAVKNKLNTAEKI